MAASTEKMIAGGGANWRENVLRYGLHDEERSFCALPGHLTLSVDAEEAVLEDWRWADDENDVFDQFWDTQPEAGKIVAVLQNAFLFQ